MILQYMSGSTMDFVEGQDETMGSRTALAIATQALFETIDVSDYVVDLRQLWSID